jgi:hypothetical protein
MKEAEMFAIDEQLRKKAFENWCRDNPTLGFSDLLAERDALRVENIKLRALIREIYEKLFDTIKGDS